MKIEVAYARSDKQKLISLETEQEITAIEAIRISHILDYFPELNIENLDIGIFSVPCSHDHILRDGDRVEIYRDLLCNPAQMRRERANKINRSS